MKRKILLPLVLLAGLSLTGCKWSQKDQPSSKYKVEITNKTELQAEWYAGTGSSRGLSLTLTPEGNPVAEMVNGNLTVTSSNPEVANVTGLNINALAEGATTVTVKYHGAKDSVDLTILPEQTVPVKYGVTHYGTAEDPLTNEEALTVAKHPKYAEAQEDLYVSGTIASFYHAPGARTDGYVSWFLQPAQEGGEQFEIYKCKKADGSNLTDDDVWVNGTAVAHGKFTSYNGQYETSEAVFVSCEGNKPQPRTTLEKTFAEALSETKALADGADTYDYYQFEAYVTKKSGSDYFLTATQGEAIEDTKVNTIQLYKAEAEGLDALLTKNAKIKATMVLKNYHGQVENLFSVEASQIEVLEEGGTWDVIPEPEVTQRTLAEFIAGENTKAVAYEVTAEIKAFKDGATKDKYGNMTLTDGENDLTIYGSTATSSALAWNNADAYAFTNPQDFQTNPTTSAMNIGDTVTMKLIRADYKGAVQGTGIVLSVTPGEGGGGETVPEPEVTQRTLAEFIAGENTKAVAYEVTAEVKSFKDGGTTHDKYGNMVLTDGENDLTIYGSTATSSALAWNNADAYSFTNPQDFLTNEVTNAIEIGDTVTMKLIRADYKGAVQGTGIVLSVTPAPIPDLESVEVSPETATVDILNGAATKQFTANPVPAKAELGEVTWTVSPADAGVTVDQSGLVTVAADAVEEDQTADFEIRATVTINESEEFATATLTVTRDTAGGGTQEETTLVDATISSLTPSAYVNNYTDTYTAEANGVTLTFTAINNGQASDAWTIWRFGRKSNDSTPTIQTSAISGKVNTINLAITQYAETGLNSAKLYISSNGTNFTEAVDFTSSMKVGTVEINLGANAEYGLSYKIVFDMGSTGNNGSIRFSGLTFVGYAA